MGQRQSILSVFAIISLAMASTASAFDLPAGNKPGSVVSVTVNDITRSSSSQGDDISVFLGLDLSKASMKSNVETVYTPMFINGEDTLKMTPFIIAGRNRKYSDLRNNRVQGITFYKGKPLAMPEASMKTLGETLTPVNPAAGTYNLTCQTRYLPWMETAIFDIGVEMKGCANCIKNVEGVEPSYALAQNDFATYSFFPDFIYITPVAEAIKMREISARAYIDFPVNRTEIYPDYRRNPEELAKIRATIDSVKNDKDINITALHINGTASPEGGYQNNIRLAKGRTEALKGYVQGLYKFPPNFITTSFEPVDWQGLSEFLHAVVNSDPANSQPSMANAKDSIRNDQFQNIPLPVVDGKTVAYSEVLPHASGILDIVDSNIEAFLRNQKIKQSYPAEYDWLLKNVYPALRHSDYRIQFEVKAFVTAEEILEVMETQPQKLSLSELFVAANSQEPGSPLYTQAFELAVTMFPEDETANLNAANAAMQRGDLIQAERYLNRVTQETPEADYSKAMLQLMQGDFDGALNRFRSLANSLNSDVAAKAKMAVAGLEQTKAHNERKFIAY